MQNITEYAEGFNQGMSDAVSRFSLMVSLLFASYLLKIVLDYPRVNAYVNGLTRYDLADHISYGADVLAFFIVLLMFLVSRGVNVYIIG
jgi:hypothetical protein